MYRYPKFALSYIATDSGHESLKEGAV